MAPLRVRIMGSGNAAQKQEQAFRQLPRHYEVVPDGMNADITSICTPNFRHFDDILCSLRHGHVFIEKPMCASLLECDRIQEAIGLHWHSVFPICQYRYADHSEFVDTIVIEYKRPQTYWTRGWRSSFKGALGGTVAMHGIHGLDLLVDRYSMPTAVQCKLWGIGSIPVETRALVALQWANGSICTLGVAADHEVGSIEQPCNWSLGDPVLGYRNQFERTYENLFPTGQTPPPCPNFYDGRNMIELLTACYKSFLFDQWVTLPTAPSDEFYSGWVEQMEAWFRQPEPVSLSSH